MSGITTKAIIEVLQLIATNIDNTSCNTIFIFGFRNDFISFMKSLFPDDKVITDKLKEHPTEPTNDITLTAKELYTIFVRIYEEYDTHEEWKLIKQNLDEKYKDTLV